MNEPLELQEDTPVYFRNPSGEAGQLTRFYIAVDEPCIVKISTWKHSGNIIPSLFVGIENTEVSQTDCTFKS